MSSSDVFAAWSRKRSPQLNDMPPVYQLDYAIKAVLKDMFDQCSRITPPVTPFDNIRSEAVHTDSWCKIHDSLFEPGREMCEAQELDYETIYVWEMYRSQYLKLAEKRLNNVSK